MHRSPSTLYPSSAFRAVGRRGRIARSRVQTATRLQGMALLAWAEAVCARARPRQSLNSVNGVCKWDLVARVKAAETRRAVVRAWGGWTQRMSSVLERQVIEERVAKIIVEQLGVKAEDVKPEASFVEDLGADSLDTVELVMALEEEFETEI